MTLYQHFSTLYTKIPHDKLISKMTTFVKKLFDTNPEKPYICCSDKGRSPYWSKRVTPCSHRPIGRSDESADKSL